MKIADSLLNAPLRALALLPLGALYVISDGVAILLRHVVRYRRKVVRKNLAESFPDKSVAELRDIERRFYRNFADYIFETVKLLHISDKEMSRRMVFENIELVDRLLGEGRSIAVYFSHCGNWEWAPSITLHTAFPPDHGAVYGQVYRPLRNRWFDTMMLRIRSRFGSHSYPKKTVLRDLIKEKRNGLPAMVGFMSDQKPSHGDTIHVVSFLNHPTAVITGTETLARRLDMAAIYWDMEKVSRGHYKITNRLISDRLADEPQYSITDRYAAMLEKTIMRDPAVWLWSHKRWKHKVTFADDETKR